MTQEFLTNIIRVRYQTDKEEIANLKIEKPDLSLLQTQGLQYHLVVDKGQYGQSFKSIQHKKGGVDSSSIFETCGRVAQYG